MLNTVMKQFWPLRMPLIKPSKVSTNCQYNIYFPKHACSQKQKRLQQRDMLLRQLYLLVMFPDLSTSSELNENATKLANLKNGTHFSIEHFFYNNSAVVLRMKKHLEDTSFCGLSVSIYVILYVSLYMCMKAVYA